jgi:protein O-mannosyl-transferase
MSIDPRLRTALSCLALVAAVLAVFVEVKDHDFLAYDSGIYLTNNPRVLAGITWDNVHWAFTNLWDRAERPVWGANWHPVTWLSHMLDVQLFGMRASAHNLENVGWHAANSLLVFLVLQRTTTAWGKSLFVAALFALHPLHVEPVVWIVERKEL